MIQELNGTWLFIKTGDDYGEPDLIEFENTTIRHFTLEKIDGNYELSKTAKDVWAEDLTEIKYEFLNQDRIRIYRKGIIENVYEIGNTETIDCVFENDYERLTPTQIEIENREIEKAKFLINWNSEKLYIAFNEILDQPYIKEFKKHKGVDGRKILLEKFDETLLISIFDNGMRENLFPVIHIDENEITLRGFPTEPFSVSGYRII